MQVSRQDVRVNHNQRNRTRAALIEAATALTREGSPPTVAEAAERALVSRATAYRYFPTQESLLVEVAKVEPLMKPVEDLVASFPTNDPAERLAALVRTMMPTLLSDEALIRTGERIYMDTWLANQSRWQRHTRASWSTDAIHRRGTAGRSANGWASQAVSGFGALSLSPSAPKPSSR